MVEVSLCILTKDSGLELDRCLASVKELVSEIVAVDLGSSDNTVSLLREYGATVVRHTFEDDFSKARNAGLLAATKDWILILDPEEYLDEKSCKEIKELLKKPECFGYFFPVRTYTNNTSLVGFKPSTGVTGKGEYEGYTVMHKLRLFKNKESILFSGIVNEGVESFFLENQLSAKMLTMPLHRLPAARPEEDDKVKEQQETILRLTKKQTELYPNEPKSYFELGRLYFLRGEMENAVASFLDVIKLRPSFKGVYTQLGAIYQQQKQYQKALAAYKKAISFHGKDELAYLRLGVLYAKLGKFNESITSFEELLKINSKHASAYHNLALVFIKANKIKPALRVLNVAYEQTGLDKFKKLYDKFDSSGSENKKIAQLLSLDQFDEAILLLEERLKKDDQDVFAYTNLGAIFDKLERYEEAVSILKKAVNTLTDKKNPHVINLYVNLSFAYEKAGMKKEAISILKQALELKPPKASFIENRIDSLIHG